MFKKYRQLFIGVLVGGLIFGAFPTMASNKIAAVVDDIKVKINGSEIKTDAPIIYNNKTYIPIRPVAEKLGASVGWDGITKTVDINTAASQATSQTVTSKKPDPTPDGISDFFKYENEYYISFIVVKNKLKERGYVFETTTKNSWIIKKNNIILQDVEMPLINGTGRMKYEYYINTVLPITQ